MGSLFGWQQDEHDIHKFGYYYELLRDLLVEMGFGDIENLTEQPYSLEKAPWHLEVKAQKKFKPKNDKENIFMSLLDVTH